MSNKVLTPSEALARLFQVIQEEAVANPKFAQRLLDATGVTVSFVGEDAAKTVDPIRLAAKSTYEHFYDTFSSFTEPNIKKLIKDYGLATSEDVSAVKTKPKKPGLIELMWTGAKAKLKDRGV